MKKILLTILWLLTILMPSVSLAQTSEPYAVLSNDVSGGKILTFYYDDQRVAREGMLIVPFDAADRPWNEQREDITSVVFDDSFGSCTTLTSTANWFWYCHNLTTITGISNLKTDNVTNMSGMFYGCRSLTSLDVSGFKTQNVTDMSWMFYECHEVTTLDVTQFDTHNVTDMSYLFCDCKKLTTLDVSGFNTANVTNMTCMFADCNEIPSIDVSHFNTANVTDMSNMFQSCYKLASVDVSGFNTANVTTMASMFISCYEFTSLDLSSFNTANVTNMGYMFAGNHQLSTIYVSSLWSTAAVTNSDNMFDGCTSLAGGAGTSFNTGHIDATYAHIDGGTSNPGYFTNKDTPVPYAVLSSDNTTLTFYYDKRKEERNGMGVGPFTYSEYRGWHTARENITTVVFDESFANETTLTSTANWFTELSNLTTITGIRNLKTQNVTDMQFMFDHCEKLTSIDVRGFNTSKVQDMQFMFSGCYLLEDLDVSGFNTDNVKTTRLMFSACHALKNLNVSLFNTAKVTDMYGMFDACHSLESIDVSGFNTSSVENMWCMFRECRSLTSINVSGFNITNVSNMYGLFYDSYNLKTIYGANWNVSSATNASNMFYGCTSLVGGKGTVYSSDHVDYTYAHIDEGSSNPGYFTDINAPAAAQDGDPFTAMNVDGVLMSFRVLSAEDKTCEIYKGYEIAAIDTETSGVMNIPETVTDSIGRQYTVTRIGHYAFLHCKNITEVTTPSTVTSIGNNAFHDCASLTNYDLPAGVTELCDRTFYETYFKHIVIPANITTIMHESFGSSSAITVTSYIQEPFALGENAFGYSTQTATLYVPVGTIDAYKATDGWKDFYRIAENTNIQFADNIVKDICVTNWDKNGDGELSMSEAGAVTSISSVFKKQSISSFDELQYFTGLQKIDDEAFSSCTQLSSVRLPETITEIGNAVFVDCPITSIEIPSSVTTIGRQAFIGTSLETLSIPNSVTSVGISAFNATNLKSITIPATLTNIGHSAFLNYGLEQLVVESGNPVYDSRNDCNALIETSTNTLLTGCNNTVIPEDVTSIDSEAFRWMNNLTSITIPASVEHIGEYAFDVSSYLTTIVCEREYAIDAESNIFNNYSYQEATLYVPAVGIQSYNMTSPWNLFQHIEALGSSDQPETYAVLSEANSTNTNDNTASPANHRADTAIPMVLTFYYDTKKAERGGMSVGPFSSEEERPWHQMAERIENVIFDSAVTNDTTITSTAYWLSGFYNLNNIDGLQWLNTENVTDMSEMFEGCSSLTSIDVSGFKTDNVTDTRAMFYGCSGLTSLNLSSFKTDNVTTMWAMFFNCSGLTSLDISGFNTENVVSMDRMFDHCSNLTNLDVSGFNTQNVMSMSEMFSGCSSLTSLNLSSFNTSNVVYYVNHANFGIRDIFYGCSNLTTIYVGDGWTTANLTESDDVFKDCIHLVGGKGTKYDASHTDYTYAHIDEGASNPGYFTRSGDTPYVAPTEKVATPTFSWNNNELTISTTTEGATIYYSAQTADENGVYGADAFALYERPFEYKADAMLKAFANKEGMNNSDTLVLEYPYTAWQELLKATEFAYDAISQCDGSPKINQQDLNQFKAERETALDMYAKRTASADEINRTAEYLRVKANQFLDQLNADDSDIIQFADAAVKAICVQNWDTNGDGELSKNEAAAVTSLEGVFSNNQTITSFDEFQYFTGVTSIRGGEFTLCSNLTSIVFPASVTTIGSQAFQETGFTEFTIPNTITTIEEYAFSGNIQLKSIMIPASVISIGKEAFMIYALERIEVDPNNRVYDSRDNCNAIVETATNKLIQACKTSTIPSSIEAIGENAFYWLEWTSITIPASVRSIEEYAFNSSYYTSAAPKEIICEVETPFEINSNVFWEEDYTKATLYVPESSIEAYRNTPAWSQFQNILPIGGTFDQDRKLVQWRQVGGKEYRLYKASNKNDFRTNADGWNMYRTRLTLDIISGTDTTTTVVDDGSIYCEQNLFNNAMTQCMMIDVENNKMYVFANSKTDARDYSMDGYVYISPIEHPSFTKETVFTDANWGWFSYFRGVENGQPLLSHFSYMGYYDELSKRNADGTWSTDTEDSPIASPSNRESNWLVTRKFTVVGDTSSDEVTIDGVTYTVRNGGNAWVTWLDNGTYVESLTIPESVTADGRTLTVNGLAPLSCYTLTRLQSLELPSTVDMLGESVLVRCGNLRSLTVNRNEPPTLVLDNGALLQFTDIDSVNCELRVPYGSKALYESADGWRKFQNIVEMNAPTDDSDIIQFADAKVKVICVANWDTDGDGELSKAEAASVTSLGGVFNRDKDITSFDEFQYFTSVKVIGQNEFMDCNGLTSIILPNSIESIEREAFYNCRIQEITIPAGVTSISYAGLYGCFSNIYVDPANQYYTSVDGVLFNKDLTTIMCYPRLRNEESYTVPSSVTVIGGCAFYSSSLSTVIIPNGVTRFETGAFRYCRQLKSIEIPETVELIESENFEGCNSLTSVFVPASVTSMAGDVFSGCTSLKEIIVDQNNPEYASVDGILYNKDLTRLCIYPGGRPDEKFEIPESVSTISYSAFIYVSNLQAIVIPKNVTQIGRFSYCSQLKSVTVYWPEPLSISDNVFGDITLTEGTLYVPYGTKTRYEAADGWKQFQNIVEMDATIDYTFDYNGVLTVRGETTMADALSAAGGTEEVAKTITAVVWAKGTPLTNSDLQGLDNPNMLVYVADASLAPSNRDNVVIGNDSTGYLAKNIMLTDVESGNNNFYCPQEFTAEMISYTRNFRQQTEVGVSRGWETIALPFQVQTIMHEKNGLLAPFGNTSSDKHFWLRQIAMDGSTTGLSAATQILPNTPYLISMPNSEEYPAEYNQNGRVTFSSQNVRVPNTEPSYAQTNIPNVGMVMFVPTFSAQTANNHIYALNVLEQRGEHKEGSIFEANYRTVRPFEAYTYHEDGQRPAPRYISIGDINSGTTGIESLTPSLSKGEGAWYTIDGRRLQQKPTQKGVYILNGRKTIVK